MISKLPKWVWLGAGALAFIAGLINAVGFLSFEHQGITHLTGNTTVLGLAMARADFVQGAHILTIIGAFLSGCAISGAIVRDSTLKLGRRYGVALGIESLLLFSSVPFLQHSAPLGIYLASSACGLQNGMVSTYSGAVLRTTHVSGAFTDLGIFLGQLIRGMEIDRPRVRLCGHRRAGIWPFRLRNALFSSDRDWCGRHRLRFVSAPPARQCLGPFLRSRSRARR